MTDKQTQTFKVGDKDNYTSQQVCASVPSMSADERRERIATAAMAGILGARNGFMVDCGTDNAATWAVRAADALIAELDKADG